MIGGGVAIGVAATASNLLDILSNGLADLVGESGPWVRYRVLCFISFRSDEAYRLFLLHLLE